MVRKIAAVAAVWAGTLIGVIAPAYADVQMNEVVVTATKTERKQQDVTQSVTVIKGDDLVKSGATSVAEAINTTAGALVTDQGPIGSLQAVTLRGAPYAQVLVLLDGKRLNSGAAGGYDLSELPIPLAAIDRIEIVRGPASALYGSDAVGGVVNIITKKTAAPLTNLTAIVGARFNSDSLFHSGRDGNTYYTLSVGKEHSSGYHHLNNNADQTTAGIKLGYDFSATSSIEASSDYITKDIGVPGSVIYPSPRAREKDSETITGLQYKTKLTKTIDFSIRGYQNEARIGYDDPDFFVSSKSRSMTDGTEAQVNWLMNSFSVVTIGAEKRNDSMVDNGSGTHGDAVTSGYIQDEMNLGDSLILVLGGRNDTYSTFGSKWSPKASARYLNVEHGTILRASYGKSFRAPTLNDLYFSDAWGDKGNPNLRPESAEEYEGGIEQPFGTGNSIKFTAFKRRVKDLISWQTDTVTFTSTPMNIGRAHISGTETELHFTASSSFSGSLNYTIMFPVDDTTGERLYSADSHIPRMQLGGTLWIALDNETVLSLVGQSVRNYVRPGEPKWDYYTLDGKITDNFVSRKDLKVAAFIGLKNIFNRKYETVIVSGYPPDQGYPMPPQEFYGGITATF